jgi:hypothetical protein
MSWGYVFRKQDFLFNPFCDHGKPVLDLKIFDLSEFYRFTILDEGVPDGMDVDVLAFLETFFHFFLLNAKIRITRFSIEGFSSPFSLHPHPSF